MSGDMSKMTSSSWSWVPSMFGSNGSSTYGSDSSKFRSGRVGQYAARRTTVRETEKILEDPWQRFARRLETVSLIAIVLSGAAMWIDIEYHSEANGCVLGVLTCDGFL